MDIPMTNRLEELTRAIERGDMQTAQSIAAEIKAEQESTRRDRVIRFRVNDEEKTAIEQTASECGLTLSQYIRSRIFQD